MPRIASLLPSATEIVCALGFGSSLVGRSHECDFPASVAALPVLTAPKLDAARPSREIDDRVRALVSEGLSVYRVDADRLRALAPDVVVTQDQCEVCAASLQDLEAALADWTGTKPRVVSLNPMRLGDVWDDVERVGEALGVPAHGRDVAHGLRERIGAIADETQSRASASESATRPSVACIEWIDPLMAAGNWVPELVGMAAGRNVFGEAGRHSPWLEWEALRDADPDIVVVMPCGFDIPRIRAELAPLLAQPGWAALRAVRAERVFLVDGHQYFNRPGPRLVESLEILAEILRAADDSAGASGGDRGASRHQGMGWERLEPFDHEG